MAFTLIEIIVTGGIVVLLLAMLFPGLSRAREQSRAVACRSNLRELAIANDQYAKDSRGTYVPGAADFLTNLKRWHGVRKDIHSPFESSEGPLAAYLGVSGEIRRCLSFAPEQVGFEAGCGGYGYNNAYVGVQGVTTKTGKFRVLSDLSGVYAHRIKQPGETLMFADAAFAADGLIEYSFAEPRFHPQFQTRADPSIHFRHNLTANIAWCDTHVSAERLTFTWSSGIYTASPEGYGIGWFGEDNNHAFDLE